MNAHPHIHCLVTVGGLSEDETSWVTVEAEAMFAKEEVAARFRQLFLAGLRRLYRQQKLTLPSDMAQVQDEAALTDWLAPVLQKAWQANVQTAPPHCQGPAAVVKYLAAYVVGSAIRDSRILRYDGRCVVIRVKNYRTGKFEELPMTGEEFAAKFALHILPARMLRVRYAGIFSARQRKDRLKKCRRLAPMFQASEDAGDDDCLEKENNCEQDTIEDTPPVKVPYAPDCRRCGMPGMVSAGRRNAYDSHLFLTQLAYLCERLFTRLSTFDIDHSTQIVMSESLDCVTPYVVDFVADTLQPWPEIPLPDT
jgi:hypothetical protein